MKILTAKILDLSAILNINTTFDESHEYSHSEDFMLEQLHAGRIFVCKIDWEVVWYLLYQVLWGNTPLLSLIKVLPNYQWKWIGTSLLTYFEKELRSRWHNLYISSTEKTNILSQKFHEKNNLKKIGSLDMNHGNEIFYSKGI